MRRLAWIAALVVGNLTIASAEEILVPAADRDRIIKMSDGRQVRLPAGRELIRADDGRILARHRTTPQSDARQGGSLVRPPAPTQKQLARALPDGAKMPVDRWAYYVSLFGASRSVSRKHDIKTDNLCAIDSNCEITYEGAKFKADGRSVSLDKTKTETSFGGSLGLKDRENQNHYEIFASFGKDIDELGAAAYIGITRLAFASDRAVPFVKLLAAAGFKDGASSLDADAFAFGGGLGLAYALTDNFEIFAGGDYVSRNFGEAAGKASNSAREVTYGTLKQKETEMKFSLGLRILF